MKKQELVGAYLGGRIDRRHFVRGLVAGGVTATAAVTYADVLAAGASGPVPRNVPLSYYPTPGNDEDGEPVLIGRVNTNSPTFPGLGSTVIRGATYPDPGGRVRQAMISGEQTAPHQFGVQGIALAAGSSTEAAGIGVVASSAQGASLALTDSGVSIPPLGGGLTTFWDTGAFVVNTGHVWYCLASGVGAASQWTRLSQTFVPMPSPVRIYYSLTSGDGPLGNGQERVVKVTNGFTIPHPVSAVLTNLAVTPAGSDGFLAMFKDGETWPGTSNLNFTAGQFASNNATSAVSVTASPGPEGKVLIRCGGASVHFVIDVFGFYL